MTLAERAAATRQLLVEKSLLKNNAQPLFSLSRTTDEELAIASEIKARPQQEIKPIVKAEACNPKWNAEDQALIDWATQNFDASLFPSTGKHIWNRIQQALAKGADGDEAKDGSLQDALRFLKREFEKLNNQKKDARISTDTHDVNDDNANISSGDKAFDVGQNLSWSHEEQELIDWFLALMAEQLPKPPFTLSAGVTVVCSKFYDRLKLEIAAGARSPRARTGALQHDLQKLRLLMKK